MMRRSRISIVLVGFFLLLLAGACYPDKIDYVDEYDLAATMYDEDADFSSYVTFHVLDTVMHMTEDGEDDPNLSRDHDEFILETIRSNMSLAGYTELADPDSLNMPDLAITVEALSSDFYYYYWYDYWYWYPGWDWWYPGWDWWYPGYPWYPGYISSYSTGSLIVEIIDLEAVDEEQHRVGVIWTGVVDGLLSGNKTSARNRLEKQINQLFEQSPYINK